MKAQPKYKVCRRLGPGVHEKCQSEKFLLSQTRKQAKGGPRRRRRSGSEYGMQLLEKQKLRHTYGISEKQFRKYITEATKTKGTETGFKLLELLESRLDNVVFRLGLAPTRRMARQLVSHGHITVNGRKVKIPSYMVSGTDVIAIREGSKGKPVFENRKEDISAHKTPVWLAFDVKKGEGKLTSAPMLDDVVSQYNVTSVIEFYSR